MAHSSIRSLCRLAAAVLMLCAQTAVHADVVKSAAWVDCDAGRDRLTVRYGGASTDDPTAVVFWSLVRFSKRPDGNADRVTRLLEARRSCGLSGGLVTVTLRPVPMNHNLNGLCGGIVRGEASIAFDRRAVLAPTALETGDCFGPVQVIREITVLGKEDAIAIQREAD